MLLWSNKQTRNSSVNEIRERCRLNHAIVVKLYHPYTQVPRNILLPHRRIATFSAHCDFFLIIAPYKYSYLPTEKFVVNNMYGSSIIHK